MENSWISFMAMVPQTISLSSSQPHVSEISPDSISLMIPIIAMTAHTITTQDGLAEEISCLLVTDVPSIISSSICLRLKNLFASLDSYSLPQFREIAFHKRYDLVVFILMPQTTINQMTDTLVACRDLFARHCLVFCGGDNNLTEFGFSKYDTNAHATVDLTQNGYHAWQFNLFDYKQLPDWFNSRFWANPENWNKFRW